MGRTNLSSVLERERTSSSEFHEIIIEKHLRDAQSRLQFRLQFLVRLLYCGGILAVDRGTIEGIGAVQHGESHGDDRIALAGGKVVGDHIVRYREASGRGIIGPAGTIRADGVVDLGGDLRSIFQLATSTTSFEDNLHKQAAKK